jgi:murein DD-endopeptidase MepM/ murein hydrolase activator NlpD
VLGNRIRAIYIAGEIDSVEVLLESTSLDDMLSRYDFLNSIANQDLSVFKEMKDLRREITVRQRDLEDQETRQRQAVAVTQQKQAELQASLSAQEALLATVNVEVLQLLAQSGTVLSDGTTSTTVTITGPFAFPARGVHTFSNDWHQPRGGGTRQHMGCDIMASMGTPAVACVNGTVTLVTEGGNAGKYLRLTMDGSSTFFYYMHMQDITVTVGQKVRAGDLVGHIGDTGNARGGPPHIHFEVHPGGGAAVNPYPLLKQFDR